MPGMGQLNKKGKLGFLLELVFFKLRGWLSSPMKKLAEAGIQPGLHVLDFGCGTGNYTLAAARMVGAHGRVYAADCQPLAVEYVKKSASRKNLANVQTILTDCDIGLDSRSIDVILLYDVFHDIEQPEALLQELARVLKSEGRLSFSDHHMKKPDILSSLTSGNVFGLLEEGRYTYTFELSRERG
jgi:ubiquinone/menaquinone biosynthesis C-methylase UbiE